MEFAIETNGLSKSYRDVRAVDSVDLRVKRGEIYGFLGLNGAGKTTTIRALLGMVRPSAGNVKVLEQAVGPHGRGPWHRVGHMVESPSAYPELTVRENLEIARRLQNVSDEGATTRAIKRLGIASYADRKAGTLSTGNLQRLGLARALLHGPELLILDEPANGLDPAGVVEIRELLRELARQQGVTVFMSSHILTEVDRLATRIGIIHKGKLIEELDADKLEQLRSKYLAIKARDLNKALNALKKAGYITSSDHDDSIRLADPRAVDAPDEVAQVLVNAGTPPTHLAVAQENLEDHFLRLTSQ
ncbi:MAG TPA: ABC transporter ATP-binding protein [Anaerolineales bacterium]|nr:ABC transporter ATP-binding protein [Anaerolineales bacterium]